METFELEQSELPFGSASRPIWLKEQVVQMVCGFHTKQEIEADCTPLSSSETQQLTNCNYLQNG